MPSVCVYTAIVGGYDELLPPQVVNDRCSYVCYTDSSERIPHPWQARKAIPVRNPALTVRLQKITCPTNIESNYTLWMDGNFELAADPEELCERYLKGSDIALFVHPLRFSVYGEAELLLQDFEREAIHYDVRRQMSRYRRQGMPESAGLFCGGIILRRTSNDMSRFNALWWEEVLVGSERDQLSLPYALWQCGLNPAIIPGSIYASKEFIFHDHIQNRRHAQGEERGSLD